MDSTTIHHLVPFSHISEDNYSFFQSFSREILNEHGWIFKMLVSCPFDIAEVYLHGDALAIARILSSPFSVVVLQQNLLADHCRRIHDRFVIIWSTKSTISAALKLSKNLRYKPIHISSEHHPDTLFASELTSSDISEIIKTNLNEIITEDPDSKISQLLIDLKNREPNYETLKSPLTADLHNINMSNIALLEKYGLVFKERKPFVGTTKSDHVRTMLKYIAEIDKIRDKFSIAPASRGSDAVIYCPSLCQHFYDLKSDFWKKLNRELGKDQREIIKHLIVKIKGYSSHTTTMATMNNALSNRYVAALLQERSSELHFQTNLISIYSSSNYCPAIRLPHGVMFHNHILNTISSLSMNVNARSLQKINKKYIEYDSALKRDLGNELLDSCFKTRANLKLVCDFPIEWLRYTKVPLMFSHEVSRICTTPGNLLVNHLLFGAKIMLTKDDLGKILIVRSFSEHDPVKFLLEKSLQVFRDKGVYENIDANFVDVRSEEELLKCLKDFDGAIVIFDCHGNHGGEESHAWLEIGGNRIDVWTLSSRLVLPPIVILSACLTHPIGGSHASVANGLLRCGAMSVIGTFLPINSLNASVYIGRLLLRISEFIPIILSFREHGVSWREIVSGFLKMSYVTDILRGFMKREKLLNEDQYLDIHCNANNYINCGEEDWFDRILNDLSSTLTMDIDDIENIIREKYSFVETMAYVHLGNPEKIMINR